ncbi:xanthine dehydrogenase family protein molybdopterin-binding subunit [Caulobacter sp. S45]|uniref:xanthine dehydrogenase family protein molybdopterin-binding subunit n=1 Tax=Caulobacter sp. S45 TaxID=1641861 RepID=UPI00131B8565|nr:xanthine dehydrogenase family protein molybdopterin-binding subunit [Caulobacter sp. S45]
MGGYIGKPIPRVEDLRFVTGRGRYTDDIKVANACFACFARAPYAHALIHRIDVSAAAVAPGVIAVLTVDDYLADGHKGMSHVPVPADAVDAKLPAFKATPETPIFDAPHLPMVRDKVRHVGEAVAMILAETYAQARDAADLVVVDYEPLPAVVVTLDAMAEGAPQIWDGAPGNICFDQSFGDKDATDKAFEGAHLVLERTFVNSRIINCQMEPRSAIGVYDAKEDVYHLIAGSQGAVRQRVELAQSLGVPIDRTQVVCPDTGGGFGPRTTLYAEQLAVTWAAKRVGRPVKWTSDRSEAFLTDYQGRGMTTRAAMAFDKKGRILGMKTEVYGNIGGHTVSFVPVSNNYRVTTTTYAVPAATVRAVGVLTNTTPTAPFRGAGRPEAHYVIERLLDTAAKTLKIDRIEIRRRNLIPKSALPYRNALGLTYDSGDFHGNMKKSLERADWDGFPVRREASEAQGKLRGIAVANYVESPVGAPRERIVINVRMDGTVEIMAGTQSTGQGHETTFAQVVADHLSVDMKTIRLVTGDTRIISVGGGTHSDRSMRLGGTLLVEACADIVAQARVLAARAFERPESEIVFEDGMFTHPSTNRAYSIFEAAALDTQAMLTSAKEFSGRMPAYPTGCAVCELEIDPDTGVTQIVRYTSIDDVGQPINPLIVDGQVHGGIAQGVGQALMEDFQVDPATGQVLGGSFMDYGVPRADHFPHFDIDFTEDPTAGNPLRVKGGGESGITPATAVIINAVVDALSPYGIEHIDLPATPMKIWKTIDEARKAQKTPKANAAPTVEAA